MKMLIGAIASALLAASPAWAQPDPSSVPAPAAALDTPPSRCPDPPSDPSLPDGARANYSAMLAGNVAYSAWAVAYQQVLVCRRAEALEARAISEARDSAYNGGAEHLNTVTASWMSAANAYEARQNRAPPPR